MSFGGTISGPDRVTGDRIGRGFGRMACLLFALVAWGGATTPAGAQVAPDGAWRTLTTPHFRITYPAGTQLLGERVAERAEAAYRGLADTFVEPPEDRIEVLISDDTDVSNGFASVFPTNRITLFASPPTDGISLSYFDDWLELVIVHELAHIYHLDLEGTVGSVVRSVFGRIPMPWPVFPGLTTPAWTREGLATYYESALTGAGRTHGTYHETVLRTAVLEDRFETLDQMSGRSPVWPDGDRSYVYGSRFFERLLDRHGEDRMADFARSVADQWVPFRLNDAAEDAFGVSFSRAWEAWKEDLEAEVTALRDSLSARAPLTRTEALTTAGRFALYPRPSPDGRWVAYGRSDGRSDAQIRLRAVEGSEERSVTRTNSVSNLSWSPDGTLVFGQLEYADPYRLWSDLYRTSLQGGVRRITWGARLDQPDVAPDGRRAVAVQEGYGTNRLVEVDLTTGEVRPLIDFDSGVHWAYPTVSPDGRRIAVSRWEEGRHFDVVVLDRDGVVVARATRDRAVDLAPSWSPDGRWLVWASDRSGIWNVYAASVDPSSGAVGPTRQLTNVLTGVAFPAVGPEGERLYLSRYHAHGWQAEWMPFHPEDGFEPFPLDPRFQEPRLAAKDEMGAADRASAAGEEPPGRDESRPEASAPAISEEGFSSPYSPLPTVLPHYWAPGWEPAETAIVEGDGGSVERVDVVGTGLGIKTSGRDLVGRHSYRLRGTVGLRDGRFQGGLGYTYSGLGNPVLGLSASQTHDAAPRALIARTEDGSTENLFLVERDRRLGVASTFVRRRYRDVVSASVAGSFIREHRELLGPDLEPSQSFGLSRPDRTLWEGRVTLTADNSRFHPFSISREDGVRGLLQLRSRVEGGLPDDLAGDPTEDRAFRDAILRLRGYRSLGGPGFANHVLAVRFTGGVAGGPGADAFHYEVGGGTGRPENVTGLGLFGGSSSLFPVRGFGEGVRFGRYAWSASAEYRFPLAVVNKGWSLVPFHLDRISGSLFADAGNAWGPELGGESIRFQNPAREVLASTGAELSAVTLPLWSAPLTIRTGVAVPVQGGAGSSVYLRVGASF